MATSTEATGGSASNQDWACQYILSTDLGHKTNPPRPKGPWLADATPRNPRPGRPPELKVTDKKPKSIKLGALHRTEARARLHHKFWHHELQAAELMCWAMVRFPDTPTDFKDGLVRIFLDEVRHMSMYESHIRSLGHAIGDFEVRDWFWDRIPSCETPLQFVALLGMGLEAANLDHTARFAHWLRSVGDDRGASIQEQVGREEVAHVRFATRWFRTWSGGVDFERWCAELPAPLSPLLMRGKSVRVEPRLKAELPPDFVDSLRRWSPTRTDS